MVNRAVVFDRRRLSYIAYTDRYENRAIGAGSPQVFVTLSYLRRS